MLQTHDLVKSYRRRRVVNGMSVNVDRGEVVGLLGKNGAGKTTTFYMVVGLVTPDEGKITLDGADISRMPMHMRARHGIGYLPQEASVFRKLTVEENILAVWQMRGVPKQVQRERLEQILDDFQVQHVRKSKGFQLSGGERRRVEIARAMAADPSYLLLDEPFTGIDPIASAELRRMIRKLVSQDIGILITDHNVRDTLKIVDRAYIVNEGEQLDEGSPDHIANSELARRYYLGEDFSL